MKRDPQVGYPLVEGLFYPAEKDALSEKIDSLLKGEKGDSPAVILPHAAYEITGEACGRAFNGCSGRKVSRILILAPAHREPEPRASLPGYQSFATPLGEIITDGEILEKLKAATPLFREDPMPFEEEHSLELIYPFLIKLFPGVPVVPVLLGSVKKEGMKELAKSLRETFLSEKSELLTVISTNMSRFITPSAAEREADSFTKFVTGAPLSERERQEITACGMNCVDLFSKAGLYEGRFREGERFFKTGRENRKEAAVHYGTFLFTENG